jgi:hypothetical protein
MPSSAGARRIGLKLDASICKMAAAAAAAETTAKEGKRGVFYW